MNHLLKSLLMCVCFVVAIASASGGEGKRYKASYSKNLKVHVGILGVSDGEPLRIQNLCNTLLI